MFSDRVPRDLTSNRLTAALADRTARRAPYLDLTLSNPTAAGFAYDRDLLVPLGDARGLTYAPDSLGMLAARRAVAADFSRRQVAADPTSIVLTASTSEAYSLLFKVLCNPHDEVLVPRPSYPLFEHLTRLDAVTAIPYDLEYHGRWSIDLASVERAIGPRTRAVLLVNPNNPTGNMVVGDELERVVAIARASDVAIISDEVFADYSLQERDERAGGALVERDDVLAFTLGGLSKSVGLPQLKLGWIVVSGARNTVAEAIARVEIAADTYLSVATPVQAAAAELLTAGAAIRHDIQRRVRANYARLRHLGAGIPACTVLAADAGWYGILQVPALEPEEDLVLSLLADDDVLVHPGYFFDFPREAFLVVSLLVSEAVFDDGVRRVLRHIDQRVGAA